MGKLNFGFMLFEVGNVSCFSRLQGILTRKDIIRLMHEANASEKLEH